MLTVLSYNSFRLGPRRSATLATDRSVFWNEKWIPTVSSYLLSELLLLHKCA